MGCLLHILLSTIAKCIIHETGIVDLYNSSLSVSKADLQKFPIPRTKGIELCTEMLSKRLSRQEIVQSITSTYKVSPGAIDKWIRVARPQSEVRIKEAEGIRVKVTEETIAEAVKDGLLSDIEIEMVLCKLIAGDIEIEEWVKGKPILRGVSPMEIIQAARTIYQKRGSNAPTKVAPTKADGTDLEPMSFTLNLG